MTAENTEPNDAPGGDDLRARYLPVSRKELRRRREAELNQRRRGKSKKAGAPVEEPAVDDVDADEVNADDATADDATLDDSVQAGAAGDQESAHEGDLSADTEDAATPLAGSDAAQGSRNPLSFNAFPAFTTGSESTSGSTSSGAPVTPWGFSLPTPAANPSAVSAPVAAAEADLAHSQEGEESESFVAEQNEQPDAAAEADLTEADIAAEEDLAIEESEQDLAETAASTEPVGEAPDGQTDDSAAADTVVAETAVEDTEAEASSTDGSAAEEPVIDGSSTEISEDEGAVADGADAEELETEDSAEAEALEDHPSEDQAAEAEALDGQTLDGETSEELDGEDAASAGAPLSLPEPPRMSSPTTSSRPQDLPGTERDDEDDAPVPASRKSRRGLRVTENIAALSEDKLAELEELNAAVAAADDPHRVDPELLKKQQALAARAMQANQERLRKEQVEADRDAKERRRRLRPESEIITRKALRAHMESDETPEPSDYATGSIEPIQARGAHGLEIDAMVEHSTRQGARQSMMGWLVIILAVLLIIAVGVVLSFIL